MLFEPTWMLPSIIRWQLLTSNVIYNASFQARLGCSPYFALFGRDCTVPRLQEFTFISDENVRRTALLLSSCEQLINLEIEKVLSPMTSRSCNVGDLVVTPASAAGFESHVSGTNKWRAAYSRPWRVLKIKDSTVIIHDTYGIEAPKEVPISTIRVLGPEIPPPLRDPASDLYSLRYKARKRHKGSE